MNKATLLTIVLLTLTTFGEDGNIIFSNRNIPKASGNGTYHVPLWQDDFRTGAGALPGGVTVGLFTEFGQLLGSTLLRTDANAQYFATSATPLTVPGVPPGSRAKLLVRAWQGSGTWDQARAGGSFRLAEWAFTTQPLGGAGFPTPNMTGWGREDGEGLIVGLPEWFMNVTIPLKPGFSLVGIPFYSRYGGSWIGSIESWFSTNVVGGLPGGTTIYKFENGSFIPAVWDDLDNKFSPDSAAALPLQPSDGVFVYLPGSVEKTLTVYGANIGRTICTPVPTGLSIRCAPGPLKTTLSTSQFPAADGDAIYVYDPATRQFAISIFDGLDNRWTSDLTIPLGQAVYIFRAGPATNWCRTF